MTFGDLKWGDRGPDVEKLQQQLSTLGYDLAVDGIFGPETAGVVRQFQRTHGLAVDGIVGPQTTLALAKALTVEPTAPEPLTPADVAAEASDAPGKPRGVSSVIIVAASLGVLWYAYRRAN